MRRTTATLRAAKSQTFVRLCGFGRHALRPDVAQWVAQNLPGVPPSAGKSLRPLYLPDAPVLRSGDWSIMVDQAVANKVAEARRHARRVGELSADEIKSHVNVSDLVGGEPTIGISGLPNRATEASVRDFMEGFGVRDVSLVSGMPVPVEAVLENMRNSKRFRRRTVLREMKRPVPKPLAVGAVVRLTDREEVQRAVVELDRTFLANTSVSVVTME